MLHRFEEELLDVRPLVKDHLAEGLLVSGLLTLHTGRFCKVPLLFVLLANDLLILELEQLPFLFKVGDDLAERLL